MKIQTAIEEHLQKAIMLDDSIAWFDTHSDEVQEQIIDFVRYRQLEDEGTDANDNYIGFYSYWTEVFSNGAKRMGDPYTLKDTGEFYRSMFIKVLKDSIVIDADYEKMADQDWWKIDILGLNDENLEKYAEIVRENFIIYARKILELD